MSKDLYYRFKQAQRERDKKNKLADKIEKAVADEKSGKNPFVKIRFTEEERRTFAKAGIV